MNKLMILRTVMLLLVAHVARGVSQAPSPTLPAVSSDPVAAFISTIKDQIRSKGQSGITINSFIDTLVNQTKSLQQAMDNKALVNFIGNVKQQIIAQGLDGNGLSDFLDQIKQQIKAQGIDSNAINDFFTNLKTTLQGVASNAFNKAADILKQISSNLGGAGNIVQTIKSFIKGIFG